LEYRRHIAYLSNKTNDEARGLMDFYGRKHNVAELVKLPNYAHGSPAAKLLNKAISLEMFAKDAGDRRKAASLRSRLKRLTTDWLCD
jgi:hypothetical protein